MSEEKKVVKAVKVKSKEEAVAPAAAEEDLANVPLYKKWWFWLILAVLACAIVFGVTFALRSHNDGAKSDGGDVATATVAEGSDAFDSELVQSQVKVTPNTYETEYGKYYVVLIQNNSDFTVDINMSVTFYDEANNMVGSKSDTAYDVPAGKELIMDFSNESYFDHAGYNMVVTETSSFKPVAQNLEIESQNIADDKVVFTVKNTGDTPVEFAQVSALFFKDKKLVYSNFTYTTSGNSSELAAGQSVNGEISTFGIDFDSVYLYTTGRAAF